MDVLNSSHKKLIIVTGPTAVGKTALSIQLAKEFKTVVLSFDSRQFYREMSVGTAKPLTTEMQGIPHYFIDNLSIHDHYTSGMYEKDALEKLDELFNDYDTVIAVGGSGLYINALCYGIDDIPSDPEIREHLIERWKNGELEKMQEEVRLVDPDFYKESDMQNPRRVIRALEVYQKTGKPYSVLRLNTKKRRPFETLWIGLSLDRELLYERINHRVDQMIANGLLEEVKELHPFRSSKALKTVGYQELLDFLDGLHSFEKAIELIKRNSRIYARKQISWFKRNTDIHWFKPDETEEIFKFVSEKKLK